jgi:hypothetical protein
MPSYTKDEDNVILSCIQQSPNNLQMAFEKASEICEGRTAMAIAQHYNKKLKKGKPLFGLITREGAVSNVKNTPRISGKSDGLEIAELAVSILTKAERIALVKRLLNQLKDQ